MPSISTWHRSTRLLNQRLCHQILQDVETESTPSEQIQVNVLPQCNDSEIDSEDVNQAFFSVGCDTVNCEKIVCDLIIKHNYSKAQAAEFIKACNTILKSTSSTFRLPSIDKFWRSATRIINKEYFFICNRLHSHGPFTGEPRYFREFVCSNAIIRPKLSTGCYLIKISLRKQLLKLLAKFTMSLDLSRCSMNLNSVSDGQLAQELKKENSCLTLTMFCDEVPASRSSKLNIFPFYIIVNEMQQELLPKNAILFGIFVGKSKPSCANALLQPLISELSELEMDSLNWKCELSKKEFSYTFKLVCVIADAPMRAYLRSVKQFSSKFGCDWCKIEGIYESIHSWQFIKW